MKTKSCYVIETFESGRPFVIDQLVGTRAEARARVKHYRKQKKNHVSARERWVCMEDRGHEYGF